MVDGVRNCLGVRAFFWLSGIFLVPGLGIQNFLGVRIYFLGSRKFFFLGVRKNLGCRCPALCICACVHVAGVRVENGLKG